MVPTKNLLDHIEALLRLSYDSKDRDVSVKLREMADELRILISVTDIANLAAALGPPPPAAPAPIPVSAPNEIATVPDFVTANELMPPNEFVTASEPLAANEPEIANELVAALYAAKPKRKRKAKDARSDEPAAPRPKRKAKKRADPKD